MNRNGKNMICICTKCGSICGLPEGENPRDILCPCCRNQNVIATDLDTDFDSLTNWQLSKLRKELIKYYVPLINEAKVSYDDQVFKSVDPNVCPQCGNTSFTPVKRKWSIWNGYRTEKIDLVCNKCGYVKRG